MKQDEEKQRQAIAKEALEWLNTPYHHMGRVKGAGVDCGMFLLGVFENCGLIKPVKVDYYPHDWHLHRDKQQYLEWLSQYTKPVDAPEPGDIVAYKYGRCISHGAIVIKWPQVIHAYIDLGVVLADASKGELAKRQQGFYSYWGE
ncbi:hydrolase [bacterium BFN5]|nr:hydrolase [bacterium BFN5]QJW45689.1 hydrolase [bacterium BFN5]